VPETAGQPRADSVHAQLRPNVHVPWEPTQTMPVIRITNVKAICTAPDGIRLVVVKVETSDPGLYGWGCATFTQRPLAVVSAIEDYLKPMVIGRDPNDIEDIWQTSFTSGYWRSGPIMFNAMSGIDQALWDIKGKHLGVPVWELLGGKSRDKVRLYLLMGGDTPESAAANARAAVDDGFTAIKFDPIPHGFGDMTLHALVAGVEANVEAARDAVGGRADVILELHRKLTPLHAIPVAEAVRRFQPLFIEDPIQIDSIQSQGEISKRINAPLRTANACTPSGSSANSSSRAGRSSCGPTSAWPVG